MQTVCTSLQTDNHTNTPTLNFYRPDALPGAQPMVSIKALKAKLYNRNKLYKQNKFGCVERVDPMTDKPSDVVLSVCRSFHCER